MPEAAARWTGARAGRRAFAVALGAALLGPGVVLAQPGDPWFVTAAPAALKARVYTDPGKRFTIEYPAKDWEAFPGGIQSVVSFHHKKGLASVIVERQTLDVVAEQRFVNELFVSLRGDEIRKAEPDVSTLEHRVIEAGAFRIAVLVFSRAGAQGPESLRVYHMLRGRHLYRIVCRALQGQAAAFDTLFAHMAATFDAPVTD